METENANQEAFPDYDSTGSINGIGLTKREYFAAMAMQGYCANEAIARNGINITEKVQSAIMMADELLKQLNQ